MLRVARPRLGVVLTGDALVLPFADGAFERVLTSHFYGHLPPEERRLFLSEAQRVAGELIVVDSALRPGVAAEEWQDRVRNDGVAPPCLQAVSERSRPRSGDQW